MPFSTPAVIFPLRQGFDLSIFSGDALIRGLTSLLLVSTIMAFIASFYNSSFIVQVFIVQVFIVRFLPHICFPFKVNEPLKTQIYTVPLKILKLIWMNSLKFIGKLTLDQHFAGTKLFHIRAVHL